MNAEEAQARLGVLVNASNATQPDSPVEHIKKQRLSALVDGISMGVGVVFILLGVLMPITNAGMLVQGLLSIIGGIVVVCLGAILEVYSWAKLH
ncbi:MAG: hypothetical protein JSV51_00830 [Candidatus Bathyarchaeota archaeon]|nr:MAG: hypothetical protein JSV51_00830 [Candidatus Bathyarchaeota archaeon]